MVCTAGLSRSAFSALATEIKLEIFDNIRSKSDRGSICLVSKEWHWLMKPQMWRRFTSSVTSDLAENLRTRPENYKACFHLIRALTFGGYHLNVNTDSHLSCLLHILRDDQLAEFNGVTDAPLHARQLISLINHQSNLRCLRVRMDWFTGTPTMDEAASWATDSRSLLTSALHGLKTLRIYVGDSYMPGEHTQVLHENEVVYNNLLIKAAPRLDRLEIVGWRWHGMPRNQRVRHAGPIEHAVCSDHFPRTLKHLVITNLDFGKAGDGIVRALNLDILSVLRLDYCDRVGAFIRALAATFRQRTTTALKVLTIRNNRYDKAGENDCMKGAMEDLLSSFGDLVELECSYHWAAWTDWKQSLRRHGELKKLHVSSMLMTDGCSNYADTIADMLAQCQNLQYFAYQPTSPYFGYIIDCQLPTGLITRLRQSLDAVAAAPSVHTLRLLYAPGIGEDKLNRQNDVWVAKAAQLAHRLATLILTHLHLRGSKIKLLALSAESRWKHIRADSNHHFYPHYFYKPQITDSDGQKVVHAVPLRDFVAEFPDFAVFT